MIAQASWLIESNSVVWQHIYNEATTAEAVAAQLRKGPFEDVTIADGRVSANMRKATIDYKGAGHSVGFTPFYISGSSLNGQVTIDIKDDKYRVTVTSMHAVGTVDGNCPRQTRGAHEFRQYDIEKEKYRIQAFVFKEAL